MEDFFIFFLEDRAQFMSENFERIDQLFAENLSNNLFVQPILQRLLSSFRRGNLYCLVTEDEQTLLESTSLLGNELFLEKGKLFLARNYLALQDCFKQINRLERGPLKEGLFICEKGVPFFEKVQKHGFSLLTGGPGTGKSTLISQLAKGCQDLSIVIATPTGKSAQRIKEALVNAPVMTLHKLLSQFRSYPFLPFDLIIIDECSMVDLHQFQKLVEKIPQGTRLILVGDHNQLPPVEGCPFFRIMVEAKKEQTSILQKVHRTNNLQLLKIAEEIHEGKMPFSYPLPPLEELIQTHFSNFYHEDLSPGQVIDRMQEIQLLTPFKKGSLGCDNLNERFYQLAQQKKITALPIIITKNDEILEVSNGDRGVLFENKIMLTDKRWVSKYQVQYQLAFALSVHKSQGSEVNSLVLLLPKGFESFGKELIYTAVTRAKKDITIYSSSLSKNNEIT